MCGRSRCALDPERVAQLAGTSDWVDRDRYRPLHNVAPGAWTPVVRRASATGAGGAAAEPPAEVQVQTMRWGLVPWFTKPDAKPDPWRMFNARAETAADKPAFRRLVPSRRCLVILDGFYEWKKEAAGPSGGSPKQPYYVHLAGDEPMVVAGLWDEWQGPDGPLHTYVILTCDACPRLEWLHDRMPVVLRDEAAQRLWLDTDADVR
jgi:putative SOS response-associated peptidase YedK